ncbi:MAG: protein kinase [Planctomycetota bacterium]
MTDPNTPKPTGNTPLNDPESEANAETVADAAASGASSGQRSTPAAASTDKPGSGARAGSTAPMPEILGRYRVLGEIGRGGMGSVYAAVRADDAFKQRVAIKVMRLGLDTEDMLARFELERQVLGAINHPNIARVYDAGVTPDGRPYFVMELVEGKPIDRYCDDNMLSVQARLELFAKVCAAVHVAHQNLVVHRDIKPANILITAEGEPKLLDFGIAKLLNPQLASIDPMTRADQRLLTYEYASPEQVTGDPITTASDVYALGVLLYELLAGHRPYEITKRVYEEAVRVICSTEPQRPSTAVSRAITTRGPGEVIETITGEEIARRREMQLARLKRRLSGDLDNIVLKAMRKTPTRRYTSAEDLAADIDRHLTGQTVTARPPTWDYRASKFVRRHKAAVVVAAIVGITITGGAVATTWQWQRADAQRELAETRYEQLRSLAAVFDDIDDDLGQLQGATAVRVAITDTLVRTLEALEPAAADDPQLSLDLAAGYRRAGAIAAGEAASIESATRYLDAAAEAIVRVPDDTPRRASELARINLERSRVFGRAGDPAQAEALAIEAVRVAAEAVARSRADARDPAEAISTGVDAFEQLAVILLRRGEFEAAGTEAERAIDLALSALEVDPDSKPAGDSLAQAHEIAGRIASAAQDHARATDAFSRAIDLRTRLAEADVREPENLRRLITLHERLGREHLRQENTNGAEAAFTKLQLLAEQRFEANPFSSRAFEDLARSYESAGDLWFSTRDYTRAQTAYQRFLERAERGVEADPIDRQRQRMLALALKKIADVRRAQSEPEAAIEHYRRSLARYIPLIDSEPQNVAFRFDELWITYFLGRLLEDRGDTQAALRTFARGLDAGEFLLTRPSPEPRWGVITAECARGLARQHLERDEGGQAVQLLARAQTLRPSATWNTLNDEARAFRLIEDATAERDRLQRLIDTVNELVNDERPAPEAAIEARAKARVRLAELG